MNTKEARKTAYETREAVRKEKHEARKAETSGLSEAWANWSTLAVKGWNYFITRGWVGKTLIVLVTLGLIGTLLGGNSSETTAAPEKQATSVAAPAEPTEKAKPLTPVEKIDEALPAGSVNEDESYKGMYVIEFDVDDNLTMGMVRTGINMDILDIVETVDNSGVKYKEIGIRGNAPMMDASGNEFEGQAVWVMFDKATVDNINWDNKVSLEASDIADVYVLHPAFKE